jgi:hypothetical protein
MKNRIIVGVLAVAVCLPAWARMHSQRNQLRFETFAVPGTPVGNANLGVETINDFFQVVGYTQITSGSEYHGWERGINGKITPLNDPLSTTPAPYTFVTGNNDWGVVTGYFWNSAPQNFSGFFYANGKYTTYNIPGLPAYSDTLVYSVNDLGDFCGLYQLPPNYTAVPFVNIRGTVETANFNIPASVRTYPLYINDLGQVAGSWYDSAGKEHGFLRDANGSIQLFDAPGAGPLGTQMNGWNVRGWKSGHYWDANNYEHGFVLSPRGKFYAIDVPGAATALSGGGTSGGGINNEGFLTGHYDPADGGPDRGYIVAIPPDWR